MLGLIINIFTVAFTLDKSSISRAVLEHEYSSRPSGVVGPKTKKRHIFLGGITKFCNVFFISMDRLKMLKIDSLPTAICGT